MKFKDTLENYVFVAPAVIIFSVFYIIPFIWVFQLGLFEWDGISFTKTFVGLANFKEIFFHNTEGDIGGRCCYETCFFLLTFDTLTKWKISHVKNWDPGNPIKEHSS